MNKYLVMYDNGEDKVTREVWAKTHEDAAILSAVQVKNIIKIYQVAQEWEPSAVWKNTTKVI